MMHVINDIIIDTHSDSPITDPPGLALWAAELMFDGECYVFRNGENLGEKLIAHVRAGRSLQELLTRYMHTKRAMIASFVAPMEQELSNGI